MKEYLLNTPAPAQYINTLASQKELDINIGPMQVSEVQAAIQKLKGGKVPGADSISAELLKQKP